MIVTGESRKPRQRSLGGIPGHVPAEQSVIFSGIRTYLREVLARIAEHPINRIEELLPSNVAHIDTDTIKSAA